MHRWARRRAPTGADGERGAGESVTMVPVGDRCSESGDDNMPEATMKALMDEAVQKGSSPEPCALPAR